MFCCSPSPHATNLFNLEEAKQNEWVQKIAKIISRIWDLRHTLKQKQEEGQRGYICEVWHGCRLLCCYFTLHWTWWKTARWVFEGGMGSHLDSVCVSFQPQQTHCNLASIEQSYCKWGALCAHFSSKLPAMWHSQTDTLLMAVIICFGRLLQYFVHNQALALWH